MKFRFPYGREPLSVLLIFFAVLIRPAATNGADYFLRLTKAGEKQRTDVLNGEIFPAKNSVDKSSPIQVLPAVTNPRSSSHFNRWLQLSGQESAAEEYFAYLKQQGLADLLEPVHVFRVRAAREDSVAKQWYLDKIHAQEAWQITRGSAEVIVGVIDTGIDYTHPDLQNSLWVNRAELNGEEGVDDDGNGYVDDVSGWDFTDAPRFADNGDYKDPDNDPMDEFGSGHGTQVAGIIAAQADDQLGISGVAPEVKIMNLRAGTASGYLEEDDVARAILYAVENGARIINMSFGDVALSTFLKDVIYFAYQKNVIMVCSAGNSGDDQMQYPSSLTETISVGATDVNDYLAGFSTYGETLDLVAPGVDMLSTAIGGGYNRVNGTSFSAPVVSAIAALILSRQSQATPERVRNILKTTAEDILYPGWDIYSAAGRADALQALSVPEDGILELTRPGLNSGFAADTIWLEGSMVHPDLVRAQVSYGIGKNPVQWQLVRSFQHAQVFDDTLGCIPVDGLPDTLITIRLTMELINDRSDELRRVVYIDRTPPVITDVQIVPLYDGAVVSNLISFRSDEVCKARVFLKKAGQSDFNQVVDFDYVTDVQRIKLDGHVFAGDYQCYLVAENASGLQSVADKNGSFYDLHFDSPFQWQEFNESGYELPTGYILSKSTDLDQDGNREVVMSRYLEGGNFGPVEIYEKESGRFEKRLTTNFPAIPRDAGDYDGDGLSELLLGYGNRSLLFRAAAANAFPDQLIWQDTTDFWAAALSDIDGDGREEIIGRKAEEYIILEEQSPSDFVPVGKLPNATGGQQKYGIPTVLVTDLTGDGKSEIVYGDSDGDVLVFSGNDPANLTLLDTFRTSLLDATSLLTAVNVAGAEELFVASHSSQELDYEHEFDGRYWSIERFRFDPADKKFRLYHRMNVYGYRSLRDFDSGLSSGSLGGDPYLFASLYPQLYVFKLTSDQAIPVFLSEPVNSNAVLVADLDNDGRQEFLVNNGDKIVSFRSSNEQRPPAVHQFSLRPLNESRVKINWQPPIPDASIRIYRGADRYRLSLLGDFSGNEFVDSLLQNETTYFYALSAVDSTYPNAESVLSAIDSAHTSAPPRLVAVQVLNDRQLQLSFNERIRFSNVFPVKITRKSDELLAVSHLILREGKTILCGFSEPFQENQIDSVQVWNVFDEYGVPVSQSANVLAFRFLPDSQQPYLARVEILNRYRLRVRFSEPMDSASVTDPDHYRLLPSGSVEAVLPQDEDFREVELVLSGHSLAGGFGKAAYLEVNQLKNREGEWLIETQKFNLFRAASDLSNLIVYPQPVNPHQRELIFARIPSDAEITIYNLSGKPVRSLTESAYGGMHWDLKDDRGREVATGVYFYRIKYRNQQKIGKVMIVR